MKLSEKLDVSLILYKYGYSVSDIGKLVDISQNKQVITHIRKNKVVQSSKEPIQPSKMDVVDYQELVKYSLDSKINDMFSFIPDVQTNNPNVKFFNKNIKETEIKSNTFHEAVDRVKAKISNLDINNICSVCENKGFVYLPKKDGSLGVDRHTCPKCKGESIHNKKIEKKVSIKEEDLALYIPNVKYREANFDKNTLLSLLPITQDIKDKIVVSDYIEMLDNMISDFQNGKLPKNTILISAPDGFGKKHFVFQAIKECLSFDYNISPLLNMSIISQMHSNYQFKEINELINKDIVFIEITSRFVLLDAYKYILNQCDLIGVPIIFISRLEKASLITSKNDVPNVDWFDVFIDNEILHEYGYIVQKGIYGFSAKDVYQYKQNALKDFMSNSPSSLKQNSFFDNTDTIKKENLLITKEDVRIKKEKTDNKKVVKSTNNKDLLGIDM